MPATTLATSANVIAAGNFSTRLDADVITFYLDLASLMLRDMLGDTNYDDALAGGSVYDTNQLSRLKKAEALMTVGFSLPSVATMATAHGVLNMLSMGSKGTIEAVSFVKEISELAASYMSLAQYLLGDLITKEKYESVWFNVVQRVFPALDEYPTVGTMHSEAESLIQDERGDEEYDPRTG